MFQYVYVIIVLYGIKTINYQNMHNLFLYFAVFFYLKNEEKARRKISKLKIKKNMLVDDTTNCVYI